MVRLLRAIILRPRVFPLRVCFAVTPLMCFRDGGRTFRVCGGGMGVVCVRTNPHQASLCVCIVGFVFSSSCRVTFVCLSLFSCLSLLLPLLRFQSVFPHHFVVLLGGFHLRPSHFSGVADALVHAADPRSTRAGADTFAYESRTEAAADVRRLT